MKLWVIRSGEAGRLLGDFLQKRVIAVGWQRLGDMKHRRAYGQIRADFIVHYPDYSSHQRAVHVSTFNKFINGIHEKDTVVTYDRANKIYHVGKVVSDYAFSPGEAGDYPHVRMIEWTNTFNRNWLSKAAKRSLQCRRSIFEVLMK